MVRVSLLLAGVIALGAVAPATDAHESEGKGVVRATHLGLVVGSNDARENGTYAWKGVPFA